MENSYIEIKSKKDKRDGEGWFILIKKSDKKYTITQIWVGEDFHGPSSYHEISSKQTTTRVKIDFKITPEDNLSPLVDFGVTKGRTQLRFGLKTVRNDYVN